MWWEKTTHISRGGDDTDDMTHTKTYEDVTQP